VLDATLRPLIDPPLDRMGQALAGRGVSADAVTLTIPADAPHSAETSRTEASVNAKVPPRAGADLPVPYPPIERHGTIGDRRTAALGAADGTLDWLCLPNYDSPPVFGALLDAGRGGYWRFGPPAPVLGRQSYRRDTATLVTIWETEGGTLELADAMLWPESERPEGREPRRVVLRRLRCTRGAVDAVMAFRPRGDFDTAPTIEEQEAGAAFQLGDLRLSLWASFPLEPDGEGATASLRLAEGEAAWAVLELGAAADWSEDAAKAALAETEAYWHDWCRRLTWFGPRRERVRRSALSFHLLSFAPSGALVAAPTLGLPERIGGERNYDYRFAWVRDVSLCMAILAMLGDLHTAERYMELARRARQPDRHADPGPLPHRRQHRRHPARQGRHRGLARLAPRPLRQPRLRPAPDRQLRLSRRLLADLLPAGRRLEAGILDHAAPACRLHFGDVGRARPRHLGARRQPALRQQQGHGLGCARADRAVGAGGRRRG
jgi:hypothetical protein